MAVENFGGDGIEVFFEVAGGRKVAEKVESREEEKTDEGEIEIGNAMEAIFKEMRSLLV